MRTVDRYKGAIWLNYMAWMPDEQKALLRHVEDRTRDNVWCELVEQRGFALALDYKDGYYWARWYAPMERTLPMTHRVSVATRGFPSFNVARVALALVLGIQDDHYPHSVAARPRYWKENDGWVR